MLVLTRIEEVGMRRVLVLLMALTFVFAMGSMLLTYAGEAPGPAPNSHDGIPDGSGWLDDDPPGPFGPSDPAGQTLSELTA